MSEKKEKKKDKRNTELQWKPLPALLVLPTHLEHIFTVSIAPRSCACFLPNLNVNASTSLLPFVI